MIERPVILSKGTSENDHIGRNEDLPPVVSESDNLPCSVAMTDSIIGEIEADKNGKEQEDTRKEEVQEDLVITKLSDTVLETEVVKESEGESKKSKKNKKKKGKNSASTTNSSADEMQEVEVKTKKKKAKSPEENLEESVNQKTSAN